MTDGTHIYIGTSGWHIRRARAHGRVISIPTVQKTSLNSIANSSMQWKSIVRFTDPRRR